MKRSREEAEQKKEEPNTPELPKHTQNDVLEFISARGRTGPLPSQIHGKFEVLDDDMIKLRIDDEQNLEFWLEAFVKKKLLLDFLNSNN